MFTEARKEKGPESTGSIPVSVQRALIPPDRHITTSFQTLAEESPGEVSDRSVYDEVARLIENTSLFDFQAVRRRLKSNFDLFALAAAGKKLPLSGGKAMLDEAVQEQEMHFLEDFFLLLQTAHFKMLTEEEYQTASDNDFTVTNPMEIAWEGMDTEVLRRFSEARPEDFFNAASICDNVLVMHRGVREVKARGLFLDDKIDLLVLYLLAEPFQWLFNRLFKTQWKEVCPWYQVFESSITPGCHRGAKRKESQQGLHRPQVHDPLLDHVNARWVERVTLKTLMPDTKSVFKLLLKNIEIREPAFKDVIILYRRKIDQNAKPSSEKEILRDASPEDAARNLNVKRFVDVPMADIEVLFPDKKVFMKPLLIFQLLITIIIGLVSVIVTLLTTKASWSLIGALLSIVGTRAYQVWYTAQLGRQNVLDMITDTLYEKTMDAQEGVLFFLLDQMAEQHVKELMLAYFMLLRFGKPLSQQQLDEVCEEYLKEDFGESVDFALENSLPVLLKDGLIIKDAQGLLRPVPIAEGQKILRAKGERVFQQEAKEQEGYRLPLFERLMSRKPRMSFKGSKASQAGAQPPTPSEQSGKSAVQRKFPDPSGPPPDQPGVTIQPSGKSGASAASSDDSTSKTKKGINALIQPVKGIFKHSNKGE